MVARDHCQLYSLSHKNLTHVLKKWPYIADEFKDLGEIG